MNIDLNEGLNRRKAATSNSRDSTAAWIRFQFSY